MSLNVNIYFIFHNEFSRTFRNIYISFKSKRYKVYLFQSDNKENTHRLKKIPDIINLLCDEQKFTRSNKFLVA